MSKRTPTTPVDAMVDRLDALVGRLTELVETTRGGLLNHVLWSGSRVIPAVGWVSIESAIPLATVAIGALAAQGTVTAAAEPPGAQPPTEGPGVLVVPPGWHLVAPFTGAVLTVWGTPGDTVHIVALSRLMAPSAGGGGANGGTP